MQHQSGDTSQASLEVPAVGIRNVIVLDAAGTDGLEDGELSVVRDAAERVQDHPVDPAKDGSREERGGPEDA